MLQLFFLQLSRRVLSGTIRFTVGGDAEHYTTVGANAAFLLLLVHVLTFTIMLGSMLDFVFLLCTCSDSDCPLQSAYYSSRRYCASQLLIVQVGISPFDAVPGDKQPFHSAASVHTVSTAGLGIILPFLRRLVLSSPVVKGAILQQSALL